MKKQLIVIVGPNASGKSELGIRIAKKINGEIISADSRQVYKGLNAGSGKITKKEMQGIPHHCIDVVDPKKQFTALDFKKCAQKAILDILSRGKTPIIVGGTGFYIDVALGRVKLGGAPPNHALRRKLAKKSAKELFTMLKKLDPKQAKTIEQKNPRRLIRAIEIARGGGTNVSLNGFCGLFSMVSAKRSKKAKQPSQPRAGGARMSEEKSLVSPTDFRWIGIKRSPEDLKKRIHKRLIKRLPAIIREIKKLRRGGLSWKRMYELGLEYRYVHMYVRGKMEKQEMQDMLERETNKYARRQMTWFKRNKKIKWFSDPKYYDISYY